MAKAKDKKRTKAQIESARRTLRRNRPKGKPPGWVIAKRARWALSKLKKRSIPLDLPVKKHHASDDPK